MNRKVRKQAFAVSLSMSIALSMTVPDLAAYAQAASNSKSVIQTVSANERKSQWPAATSDNSRIMGQAEGSQEPQQQLPLPVTEQDKFLASLGKNEVSISGTKESRIIVKYKQNANVSASAYRTQSALVADEWALPGTDLAVLETSAADMNTVIGQLEKDPNVLYAEPDVKVHMASIPNDPMFPDQWGLRNVGQIIDGPIKGLPGFDINAPKAWDISQGSSAITVAVIDTGVDINHPDLKDNIWRNTSETPNNGRDDDGDGFIDDFNGWDFYNGDNTVFDAAQGDYHGTEVAGIIAASANNGIGISGVAPKVKILPLKVLGPDGTGYVSDVIRAIQYAERAGAQIANLSWTTDTYSKALKDAIEASPMLFTVSAGNEPKEDFSLKTPKNLDITPVYPGSYRTPNMVTVGSVSYDGDFAYFSNYGPNTVDLAAPGIAVLSTEPSRNIGLGAQIDNGTFKAVYNVLGFESINEAGKRQEAFNKAMQFLITPGGPAPSVLLVQDDLHDLGSQDYLNVYKQLLQNAGYSYDVKVIEAGASGPSSEELKDYDAVIWFTGLGNSSFTPEDVDNVTAYLNAKGRLLLTGPGTLFRLADTSFMRNMLHLDFVRFEDSSNESWNTALGTAGSLYEGAQYTFDDLGIFSDVETNNPQITRINLEIPLPDYGKNTGTSMSAPYAAGVAALVLSQDLTQDAETLKARLKLSGKRLASLQGKTSNGKMLDAFGALSSDELPGKPLAAGLTKGTLDTGAKPDDVYMIHLLQGDRLSLSLKGSTNTDFDLYLFDPSAETIQSSSGMVAHSETEGSSAESISYQAPETGYYFINVHAFDGKGSYELVTSLNQVAANGTGVYEDSHQALTYKGPWKTVSDTGYSKGTIKQLNAEGSVSFAFTGTEISWLGVKGPDQGIADVYIDGVKVASPSLFNRWKQLNYTIFKQTVSKGTHTLTIKWTGNQEQGSMGSTINVDAISVTGQAEPNKVQLQENDSNFKYTGNWKQISNDQYSSGHAMASYAQGDEAVLTFTGTRAVLNSSLLTGIQPLIAVTVDDKPETEKIISLNGDKEGRDTYQVPVFDTGELANGKHTLRIINVTEFIMIGQLPLVIDSLTVTKATSGEVNNTTTTRYEDTNAKVKFTGIWATNLSPNNSGNSSRYSNQALSTVEFAFRGSELVVRGIAGPDRGKADIYIDGKLATPNPIDLYRSSYQYKASLFELKGLTGKEHTVKIVNLGEKNPKSAGTYLSFDVFEVISDQFVID